MVSSNDNRDPAQKLKDLHAWLMDNKVSKHIPNKPPMTSLWAEPISPRATAEVEDFQNWVKEIQSPHRLAY